jgi:hypothetical protein
MCSAIQQHFNTVSDCACKNGVIFMDMEPVLLAKTESSTHDAFGSI